jgi:hypothetical protein
MDIDKRYVSKLRQISRTPRIDLQFVRKSLEKQRVWVGPYLSGSAEGRPGWSILLCRVQGRSCEILK